MSREITDDYWIGIVERTTLLIDDVERYGNFARHEIEEAREMTNIIFKRGANNPDRRLAYYNTVKVVCSDLGISFRQTTYPDTVMNALHQIYDRTEEMYLHLWNISLEMNMPLLRHGRAAKSLGYYYETHQEYAQHMARSTVAKLKKLFREECWDGTLEGLHDITVNEAEVIMEVE
jgi:hypothetical protein